MTGLVYLDISIGVIFLILVFSLFAGAIQEAVAAIFNLRAKTLRAGILRMIGDTKEFRKFWNTPLIDSLKGPGTWTSRAFDPSSTADNDTPDQRNPSQIPTNLFTKSVLHHLREELKVAPNDLGRLVERIREEAAGDKPGELVRRVAAVIEGVESQTDAIEAAIGAWYEATRDRFAGWYVRRTQWVLFVIGLVLAIITNTDPIRYGQELRENDALRKQVVVMAEEVAALDDLEDVLKHVGVAGGPATNENTADDEQLEAIRQNLAKRLSELSAGLENIGSSAGWSHCGDSAWVECFLRTANPFDTGYREQLKRNPLLGWFLLALAVMLGAQFWLDTLRKFVSIRSAGAGLLGQDADRK